MALRLYTLRLLEKRNKFMNIENIDMQEEYDFSDATQGAVIPPQDNQTQVLLRIDNEVLDWFRHQVEQAGGGNYQQFINLALHEYVLRNRNESLETTLRRIIREEINIAA
jgi:uncharacterized protein (DUF4415 family)